MNGGRFYLTHKPLKTPKPPLFLSRFSSSSSSSSSHSSPNDQSTPNPNPSSSSSSSSSSSTSPFAAYFSDVKSKLNHQQNPSSKPSKAFSSDEMKKNLSQFRLPSTPSSPTPPVSFEELYKKNVSQNEPGTIQSPHSTSSPTTTNSSIFNASHVSFSLKAIRNSLKQRANENTPPTERRATSRVDPAVFGGTLKEIFSRPVFKDKDGGEKGGEGEGKLDTELFREYSMEDLGGKLRKLRSEEAGKKEGWFSLEELNVRLRKLRELEEEAAQANTGNLRDDILRSSLEELMKAGRDKTRKNPVPTASIFSKFGVAPNYMLQPPKEELLEKYFHPDNMSAKEKLKIELAKVREEFKMSESDCGSTRVQIAQLTTKIKYLSSVLHKKDKHSLRGLQALVQQRKKLLKYLRRTDWDSYCLVLDKLGLRDNADSKIKSQ